MGIERGSEREGKASAMYVPAMHKCIQHAVRSHCPIVYAELPPLLLPPLQPLLLLTPPV